MRPEESHYCGCEEVAHNENNFSADHILRQVWDVKGVSLNNLEKLLEMIGDVQVFCQHTWAKTLDGPDGIRKSPPWDGVLNMCKQKTHVLLAQAPQRPVCRQGFGGGDHFRYVVDQMLVWGVSVPKNETCHKICTLRGEAVH